MKRFVLILIILSSSVFSQNYNLNVNLKDGSTVTVAVADIEKIMPTGCGDLLPPDIPTGPSEICSTVSSCQYQIPFVANATSYLWEMSPLNAGTILADSNTCTINWNQSYLGDIELLVTCMNACDESSTSYPLRINRQTNICNPAFGHFTELLNDVCYGWATDIDAVCEDMTIYIFADGDSDTGTLIGTSETTPGDNYLFSFTITPEMKNQLGSGTHNIMIYIADANGLGYHLLSGSPHQLVI